MASPTLPRAAAGLCTVAGLGLLVAATLASKGTQVTLAVRPSTSTRPMSWPQPMGTITMPSPETGAPAADSEPSTWFTWLLVGLAVAAVAVVLVAVAWGVRSLWRRPRVTAIESHEAPLSPDELAAAAALQRARLGEGTPRNAIVAAWVELEAAAARAGAARDPAETSSEYVERVLRSWPVDAAAISRFAALYREARFSEHELDESHRAAAAQALDTLETQLAAAVRNLPEPSVPS